MSSKINYDQKLLMMQKLEPRTVDLKPSRVVRLELFVLDLVLKSSV